VKIELGHKADLRRTRAHHKVLCEILLEQVGIYGLIWFAQPEKGGLAY